MTRESNILSARRWATQTGWPKSQPLRRQRVRENAPKQIPLWPKWFGSRLNGVTNLRIFPGVHYRDNGRYAMYADQPACPRARLASDRVISLPMHLRLEESDVQRVCDSLRPADPVGGGPPLPACR